MKFQLERRFSLPVAPFHISCQLLLEDCKVLWDPSGRKVLIVTVTRHHLTLGHSCSLILLGLSEATIFQVICVI